MSSLSQSSWEGGDIRGLTAGSGELLDDGVEFFTVVRVGMDSVLEGCFLCGFKEKVVCGGSAFEGCVGFWGFVVPLSLLESSTGASGLTEVRSELARWL